MASSGPCRWPRGLSRLALFGCNEVDLRKNAATVGPLMTVDPMSEEITQVQGDTAPLATAKKLAHGTYRKPYVMPKEV